MQHILVILCLVNAVHYAERQLLAAFAPQITSQFELTYTDTALLLSGFMVGYMVSGPIMAYFNGRKDPYKTLLTLLIIGSGAMFLMAAAGAYYYLFLVMRVALGFAVGGFNSLAPPLILEKNTRIQTANTHLGLYFMMVPVGIGLAYLAGTFSTYYTPWTVFFIGGGLVSLLLAAFYSKNYPKNHNLSVMTGKTRDQIRQLFKNPTYLRISVGYFFYIGAGWGFLSWASTFGVDYLGLSLQQTNLGLGIVTICAAACGTYLGSRFGSLFNTNHTLISGFCYFGTICVGLAIPLTLGIAFSQRFDEFLFYTFFAEMLLFAAHAPIMTSLLTSAPLGFAPVAAGITVFLVHGVGDIIFCLLMGTLADLYSWRVAFSVIPAGMAFSSFFWLRAGQRSFQSGTSGQSPFSLTPIAEGSARIFQLCLWLGAKLYFKEIYVYKKDTNDNVDAPTLYIANHPNGLVDILVLYVTVKKTLRFVAKHTLWENPVLRPLLKLGGCIPIFRKSDDGNKKEFGITGVIQDNEHAMQVVSEALSYHSFAIYPEGISHDAPTLSRFKTGGSRMLLHAASLGPTGEEKSIVQDQLLTLTVSHFIGQPQFDIGDYGFQPVGMYFDDKTEFRSRALIHYGPRIALSEIFSAEELQEIKADPENNGYVTRLTEAMHVHISKLIPLSENEEERQTAQRTAMIMLDADESTSIKDFFAWDQTVQNFINVLKTKNVEMYNALQSRLHSYFHAIDQLKVPDEIVSNFSASRRPRANLWGNQIIFGLFTALMSPFIGLGLLLYWPWFSFAELAAQKLADGDSEVSTFKFLAGAIFGGLASFVYLGVCVAVGWWRSDLLLYLGIGVLVIATSGLCAVIFMENLADRLCEFRVIAGLINRDKLTAAADERRKISTELFRLYRYASE